MNAKDMNTDPYKINEIDFLDAQWMRDHKFNPLSVKAARQARAVVVAREMIDRAYIELDNALVELSNTCAQVKEKREAGNGV